MTDPIHPPQTVERTTCYLLGRLPYVPHYSRFGIYVAPGGGQMTSAELLEAGAVPYKEFLWPRPDEFSVVNASDGWSRRYSSP